MPTIDEAIERAARALCEHALGVGAWDEITQVQRQQFIENVRAAISAYFADVPVSDGMRSAGNVAAEKYRGDMCFSGIYKDMCRQHAEELSNV